MPPHIRTRCCLSHFLPHQSAIAWATVYVPPFPPRFIRLPSANYRVRSMYQDRTEARRISIRITAYRYPPLNRNIIRHSILCLQQVSADTLSPTGISILRPEMPSLGNLTTPPLRPCQRAEVDPRIHWIGLVYPRSSGHSSLHIAGVSPCSRCM